MTSSDALAHLEAVENVFGEMPVKCEEFLAVDGFMPQNDQRSVVQRRGIVRHDMDHAIQRRMQNRALFRKKIDSQMDCAPLVCGIAGGPKER